MSAPRRSAARLALAAALLSGGIGASAAQVQAPAGVQLPVTPPASAPAGPRALPDPTPEQAAELLRSERFRTLASELRCLVCQNQTLADSSAELAGDLRNEVLRQMAAGRDDRQIKEHLVARYGEFVLYRPELSARNLALWVGPAVLLAIGAFALWRITRRRAAAPGRTAPVDDATLRRIERLLDESEPPGSGPRPETGPQRG
jgi:cytochrome c-type biogenesis protein CcmH